MAAVERLPVLYHSEDYIFISFRIIGRAHCCIFTNGVVLMYMQEGVSNVANFITNYEESQKMRLSFSICNVF